MAKLSVWTLTELLGLNPSSGATRWTTLFSLAETPSDKVFRPQQLCCSWKVRGTNGTLCSCHRCHAPSGSPPSSHCPCFLRIPGSEERGKDWLRQSPASGWGKARWTWLNEDHWHLSITAAWSASQGNVSAQPTGAAKERDVLEITLLSWTQAPVCSPEIPAIFGCVWLVNKPGWSLFAGCPWQVALQNLQTDGFYCPNKWLHPYWVLSVIFAFC